MLVTESRKWHRFDVGNRRFTSILIEKWILMTKMAKIFTEISNLSPTHFASNIRHQHRCCHLWRFPNFACLRIMHFKTLTSITLWVPLGITDRLLCYCDRITQICFRVYLKIKNKVPVIIFKYFFIISNVIRAEKSSKLWMNIFSRSRRVRFAWAMGSMVLVSMRLVKSNPKTWD